jgi:hypothetical protein
MSEAALHPVSERILSGQAPEALCKAAARGAVPVPPAELLRLQVHLALAGPEDVAAIARQSLSQQPEEELAASLADEGCPAEVLGYMARLRPADAAVMEAVVQHPSAPDEALIEAAGGAEEKVLERILDNQVRLLRCPELIDALDANPAVGGGHRTRLHDLKEELARRARRAEKKVAEPEPPPGEPSAGEPLAAEPAPAGTAAPGAAPLPPPAAEEGPAVEAPPAEAAGEEPSFEEPALAPEESDVMMRILSMTVPEKVELALKGNREERAILVRDPVKIVAMAVLKSPKLSDREVESIAAMRNVVEDVIQNIASSREWTRSYAVVHALCKNPKSPVRQVLTLMTRLNNRDLKMLGSDRNVGEVVRTNARKYFVARTQPRVKAYGKK